MWIASDAGAVYDALTTREGLDAWWGEAVTATPEEGSTITFDHGLGAPMLIKVTRLVPKERVEWRFSSRFDDPENPASEWFGQSFVWDILPRQVHRLLGTDQDVTILRMTTPGGQTTRDGFGSAPRHGPSRSKTS